MTRATDSSGDLVASFAYDAASRPTSMTRGDGTSDAFSYDPASRLTGLADALPADAAHQVSYSLAYTRAGQLQSAASTGSLYDWTAPAAGATNNTDDGLNRDAAIAALSGGYDANGNLGDDGTRTFAYDHENRLTSVAIASASTTASLAYDPSGRLESYEATVGGNATTTLFLYEGPRLVAEYDGSGNLIRRYIHGPGTDEPIAWYEGAGTSDRRFLHADAHGSIVAVSNAAGEVTETHAYGPWGETSAFGGSRFQYTGQIALAEIGLYFYKARLYDPSFGRFLQTDPIGYDSGQDLYRYASDDPVDLADPTGSSDRTTARRARASAQPRKGSPRRRGRPNQDGKAGHTRIPTAHQG